MQLDAYANLFLTDKETRGNLVRWPAHCPAQQRIDLWIIFFCLLPRRVLVFWWSVFTLKQPVGCLGQVDWLSSFMLYHSYECVQKVRKCGCFYEQNHKINSWKRAVNRTGGSRCPAMCFSCASQMHKSHMGSSRRHQPPIFGFDAGVLGERLRSKKLDKSNARKTSEKIRHSISTLSGHHFNN